MNNLLNYSRPVNLISTLYDSLFLRKANPAVLAAFRILFGALNIIMILRYFQFFDVIWFQIQHAGARSLLYIVLYCWLAVSLLLLLGIGGRITGIVQLLLSVFILRNGITFSISEIVHLICSWVFVLVRTDTIFSVNNLLLKSGKRFWETFSVPFEHSSAWGVFIIGWYFGMLFLSAGLDKAIDPLWIKGMGFYTFAILPWTLEGPLRHIADYKWFVLFCNYATILIEVGLFFFFPFAKTRFWAVLAFILLAFGLIWPFNIFFIGHYTFILSILLLSICDIPFLNYNQYNSAPVGSMPFRKKIQVTAIVLIPLSVLTVLEFNTMENFLKDQFDLMAHKETRDLKTYNNLNELTISELSSSYHEGILSNLSKLPIYKIREKPLDLLSWFISPFRVGLFSSKHLVGLYAYRITIQKSSGQIVEPVKYFQPDKSRGDYDQHFFMLNIFQSNMYFMGDFSQDLCHQIAPQSIRFIETFVHYSLSQADTGNNFVSLLVAPIYSPLDYQGQVKQRTDDWREILRYDIAENSYRYVELPVSQKFQARNPYLFNYLPAYEWNKIFQTGE